jgi:hypothetical protein
MIQALAAEEVRRTLDEVLARDPFRGRDSWWSRWIERLFERIDLPHLGTGAGAVLFGMLAVVGIALGALVLVRRVRDARGTRASSVRTPQRSGAEAARARAAELLRAARAARERGDLTLALRLTFFALVVGLGKRGALEYHDAWTNRELLARGRPQPDGEALLAPWLADLERKSFGGEPTQVADVERMEALCARLGVQ